MHKTLEGICSFLLFGSGATGLIMISVLISGYKIDKWVISPLILLSVSAIVFILAWGWYKILQRK